MDKKDNKPFKVVDIATATEPRIHDHEQNETYTITTALCKVLNDLKEIKKAVV